MRWRCTACAATPDAVLRARRSGPRAQAAEHRWQHRELAHQGVDGLGTGLGAHAADLQAHGGQAHAMRPRHLARMQSFAQPGQHTCLGRRQARGSRRRPAPTAARRPGACPGSAAWPDHRRCPAGSRPDSPAARHRPSSATCGGRAARRPARLAAGPGARPAAPATRLAAAAAGARHRIRCGRRGWREAPALRVDQHHAMAHLVQHQGQPESDRQARSMIRAVAHSLGGGWRLALDRQDCQLRGGLACAGALVGERQRRWRPRQSERIAGPNETKPWRK